MPKSKPKTAVITGASAGIGAATAEALARAGFELVLGARRLDRLEAVAASCGGRAIELDVTDPESIQQFVEQLGAEFDTVDLLVNNAGAAFGLEPIADADLDNWHGMFELNVIGVLRMTRALLPRIRNSDSGQILNVGSVAGFEVYAGGAGYTASKHALRALTKTLRLELLGSPIRVTEVAPGLTDTEFAQVRFSGDVDKARKVYAGIKPLVAEDIADCITFAATRPPHVNIDEIVVRPRQQANSLVVHREPDSASGDRRKDD